MQVAQIREVLSDAKVGIAGAGGLGSNCAVALARTGVSHLVIADFDVVSEPNLNRQYFFQDQVGMKKVDALRDNLLRINPNLNLTIYDGIINPDNVHSLFSGCDIVVEAFDLAEMKAMLISEMATQLPDVPLVCGIGLAGFGKLEALKVREFDRLYLCGDGESEVSEEKPPLAPRVGIVAHMQADLVLTYLLMR